MGRIRVVVKYAFVLAIAVWAGIEARGQQAEPTARVNQKPPIEKEEHSKDWWGFQAEVAGAVLATELDFGGSASSVGTYVFPQPGVRVHLNVLMDKFSRNSLAIVAGYGYFANADNASKDLVKSTSLFDLGLESPVHILRTKSNHRVSIDVGAGISMLHLQMTGGKGALNQWGITALTGLHYDYRLPSDIRIGARAYLRTGVYFGGRSKPLRFENHYEAGLGFIVAL